MASKLFAMKRFGERLKAVRLARGLSQRSLGLKAGVSGTSIKYWEDGTTDPENIRNAALQAAADALGVTVTYLKTGKGLPRRVASHTGSAPAWTQTRSLLFIADPAVAAAALHDPHVEKQKTREVIVDGELATQLSALAFATEIPDDALTPEFRAGDVIVVDPGIAPLPGDFVLATMDRSEAVVFMKYRPRGVDEAAQPVFELVPLNEDYETIRVSAGNPGRILGTMMEHRRRRRR